MSVYGKIGPWFAGFLNNVEYLHTSVATLPTEADLQHHGDGYRLAFNEADGAFLDITPTAEHIAFRFRRPDGTILDLVDETIAVDEDDRSTISFDRSWLHGLLDRLSILTNSFAPIDPADPAAQFAALPDGALDTVKAIYQDAANRAHRTSGLSLHLTMPTDYWGPKLIGLDLTGDPQRFDQHAEVEARLGALPSCYEIIDRAGEGEPYRLVPLALKPVQF